MPLAAKRPDQAVKRSAAAEGLLAVARPRLPVAAALLPYLDRIDAARWYSNFGPLATELEDRLAARLGGGARVCTASSGTQALILALKAMQLAPGSLVALPSWTFVASAHAVVQAGLRPWFLDVEAQDWMLSAASVRAALDHASAPVGAVMPVAAFGARPDLAAWADFRAATGIPVLIDAAAAFDSLDSAHVPICISLHATKLIGAGEGGFFACTDADLFERFRRLTSFGFQGSRDSAFPASNAKLSEYGAAVGLASLDAWPSARLRWLRAAQLFRIALAQRADVRFQPGWGMDWVGSTCIVELPDGKADAVETHLAAQGIATRRWWGEGCHASAAFAEALRAALPVTEGLARSTIGLPFAVDITEADINRTARAVCAALA